ncbi:MAG: metallophosphoesterase N-terminal domain-containing protein [Alistipes finegoldii]
MTITAKRRRDRSRRRRHLRICHGRKRQPVPGLSSATATCTQTDAEGQYVLTRNAESGFVFYSLPSGYKVNMHKTYKLPKFFTKLKPETARYDFTLTALDAPKPGSI